MQRLARVLWTSGNPWSPLSVSVIALLLPAGGAVLTIFNLQRLRAIDADKARELIIACIGVFAVGIVALLWLDPSRSNGQSINGDATGILGGGIAVVSYMMQRAAFLTWRRENKTKRTGSWLAALGTAAIYSLVTLAAAVPVMLVSMAAAGLSGHGVGAL